MDAKLLKRMKELEVEGTRKYPYKEFENTESPAIGDSAPSISSQP